MFSWVGCWRNGVSMFYYFVFHLLLRLERLSVITMIMNATFRIREGKPKTVNFNLHYTFKLYFRRFMTPRLEVSLGGCVDLINYFHAMHENPF